MIVLLDTTTPMCRLGIVVRDDIEWHEWQAERQLANGLLAYITDRLGEYQQGLDGIRGIGVLRGPGSFTGLRIGLTVTNTLAGSLGVSIIGASGDAWADDALSRLKRGENDQVVLPEYGAAAHITAPRK
ncbi:MAG: hypothetical protein WAS27_01015 [Candidatus Saccharimonadales bacterium]